MTRIVFIVIIFNKCIRIKRIIIRYLSQMIESTVFRSIEQFSAALYTAFSKFPVYSHNIQLEICIISHCLAVSCRHSIFNAPSNSSVPKKKSISQKIVIINNKYLYFYFASTLFISMVACGDMVSNRSFSWKDYILLLIIVHWSKRISFSTVTSLAGSPALPSRATCTQNNNLD